MSPRRPPPASPREPDWKAAVAQLRRRRRHIAQLARVLGLDPDSPRAIILREYLLAELFRLAVERTRSPQNLLSELQQALKALPHLPGDKKKGGTSVEQGRQIRRRWRALYGLDDADQTEPADEPRGAR